ncbi:MAG: L-threonylcarbamoyladenylate synthase [Methanosarcinales archaeon Met12]|nr:MAG: L-threonylcarbamoyladenylate synthase [Methanosarcinales archaeon Met12]
MTNVVKATPKALQDAGDIIRKGGLVAFPTETVYGLGADALNPQAVARIFEVKNRPRFDPLIVHIADFLEVERLCHSPNEKAEKLIERFWPGPLTITLLKSKVVPDIVTAGLSTVAIRMPAHPVALNLIKKAEVPIAAPSANPFGYLSPTTAEHVKEQIGEKVDMILDGGKCPIGVESTVIDLTEAEPILLRPGGLSLEEIEAVIGKIKLSTIDSSKPRSPGQLPRHYSPRTPIKILKEVGFDMVQGKQVGLLAFTYPKKKLPYKAVEVLSSHGDLREAAANFFTQLHRLDAAGLDIIYAEPVPEVGLGRAIMDRLRRASGDL